MKFLFLLSLISGLASAQAVKSCSHEILSCELSEEITSGGRVLLRKDSVAFSGINADEPSVEPSECSLSLSLEGNDGIIFVVNIGDTDYMASVFNMRRPDYSHILNTDASFAVLSGKPFYFRHLNQVLKCVLQ